MPFTQWRVSSYTLDKGQCVEVALTNDSVGVRDTKNRAGGHFTVPRSQWSAFLDAIKLGRV